MNNCYYRDLDINFAQAFELCEKVYSHEKLLMMLSTGNIPEKQIAALQFDYIKTIDDAKILLSNLTGCDGKIREAVAFSLNRILKEDINSIDIVSSFSSKIIADASIDINGNICRLAIDSAVLLAKNYNFANDYAECIKLFIDSAFCELQKFVFRDKKYIINKQLFKLYWALEAMKYFYTFIDEAILYSILKQSAEVKEYTIREKAAEIIKRVNKFKDIRNMLIEDDNYYVRQVFKSS